MSHDIARFNAEMKFGVRGKFRAVVHKGHKYDEDGNIIEFGEVIRETPFGKNIITNYGFDWWLGGTPSGGGAAIHMIAGPSNVAPVESDTAMGDAFGRATTFVSTVQTAQNTDPTAGPLFATVQHRRTFNPGDLGASAVNVAKAGLIGSGIGSPTLAQIRAAPLYCAGLLVDSGGVPTTISVQPTEYLDLIWEHTEFFPHGVTGSFTLTVDGSPTSVNYTVRCMGLIERSDSRYAFWGALATTINSVAPQFLQRSSVDINGTYNPTVLGYNASGLSLPSTIPNPPANGSTLAPNSTVAAAYVPGSKERSHTCTWALARGNASPNCNVLRLKFNSCSAFQILFSPGIAKNNTRQLELTFKMSMANVP